MMHLEPLQSLSETKVIRMGTMTIKICSHGSVLPTLREHVALFKCVQQHLPKGTVISELKYDQ